jgi:proteic killer suppression protein
MILRFRHRGLRRLFEDDDPRGVRADQVERIKRVFIYLDRAEEPNDMNLPGWRLHPLKGELAGFWSVTVTANWRIIWRFKGRNVTDVDYVDYH